MSATAADDYKTNLAVDRTWLAHERTLMAWVRTSASMISFGFTIYKFFEFEAGKNSSARHGWFSPRDFALLLVIIALVSLVAATIQNRREVHALHIDPRTPHRSISVLIAALISIFGVVVLISALARG
jgi:putative membrane protein